MTISQAIEIAVKNGWKANELVSFGKLNAVLDPGFWQSLGKGLEWDIKARYWLHEDGRRMCDLPHVDNWKMHWHLFIGHLADGKTINSFFETLR